MQTDLINKRLIKTIVLDAVLIIATIVLPVISHVIPIPLYLIEPMRIMVLGSFLLRNKNNSLFLAIILPVISFLFIGHPVFVKAIIISLELILNVYLFEFFMRKSNAFISAFFSILISKTIYYFVKYLFISLGVLKMSVISTSLTIQLFTTVAISLVLYFLLSNGIND